MIDSGRSARRQGMRAAAPLAVAVAGFGVPFGVLARTAGFDPVATVLFSATTFAGSAQFAAAAVLEAGGGAAAAVVAAALLNSRYLPMGVSVAPDMAGGPLGRLLRGQLLVDESWAVAHTPAGIDAGRVVGAGLVLYVAWVGGTTVGAFAAEVIADPQTLGLDAAFPALFLALLASVLRDRRPDRTSRLQRRGVLVAASASAIALGLTPVLPAGLPLVAAAAAALVGLRGPPGAGGRRA